MRRRLGDIMLTSSRRSVRTAVFVGQAVLSGAAVLAVLFERHHVPGQSWHSTWGEMAGAPLLVMVAVLIASLAALRWPRLDAGILGGAVGVIGSIMTLGFLVGVHVLEVPQHNAGYGISYLVLTLLIPLAVLAQITEVMMRVRERRRLEAHEPVFPTAILVRRR